MNGINVKSEIFSADLVACVSGRSQGSSERSFAEVVASAGSVSAERREVSWKQLLGSGVVRDSMCERHKDVDVQRPSGNDGSLRTDKSCDDATESESSAVCADEAANDEERGAEELIALLVFNKRQPADRKDDVPLVMTVLDCPRVLLPKSPDVSEQEASESLANAAMTAAQGPGDGVLQGAELAEVLALQQSSQPGIIEPAVFSEFVKEDGLKVVVKDSPESDDGSLSTAEQLSHNVMTVSETEAGLEQQGEDEQFGLEHDGAQTFESDLESSDAPKLGDVNPLSFEPVGHAEVGAAKPELVEPEVITRQIVAEVENAVRNAAETGSIRLEMSLEPKELGKLVIALSMENGRVAMLRIQAENSQTRVLLERYAAGLEKKFEGSTVKIETLDANSFESGHAKDAMGSGQKDNLDEQKQRQRTILMERRVEEFALSC